MRTGLSREANVSLSLGTKSAGKGFARARDRAAFCPGYRPSPAAETGNPALARAKVADVKGFFQRPQETEISRDWVVVDAARIEPVCQGNSLLNGKIQGNFSESDFFAHFSRPNDAEFQ